MFYLAAVFCLTTFHVVDMQFEQRRVLQNFQGRMQMLYNFYFHGMILNIYLLKLLTDFCQLQKFNGNGTCTYGQ